MHSYKERLHHVRQAKTLSTSWEMRTYHDHPRRLCMIMSVCMPSLRLRGKNIGGRGIKVIRIFATQLVLIG